VAWPLAIRGTILASSVGLLAGAGGFTFWYAEGASYLSDDPRACVNCHVMREPYDAWQKASHHTVATCNDCHLPHHGLVAKFAVKAENGFWHSTRFTLQDFHEPIRIRPKNRDVLNANCRRCHSDLTSELHEGGEEESGALGCVRCHAAVGHGPPK
jgi:cytochrome c nitrite reductase small subunit